MSFGTEKLLKLMRNTGRTKMDNDIDIEEWVISLLNDIDRAAQYGEPYELNLSRQRVQEISVAWDSITNVELS